MERKHHKGHEKSIISIWEGLVFDHDDRLAILLTSGVEVQLILGEKDPAVKLTQIKEALLKMGWVGDIHVIEGAGHDVVRPYVEETVRLTNQFWTKLGI